MSTTSLLSGTLPELTYNVSPISDKTIVINNLLHIIEQEYQRGNSTVTKDKYETLIKLRQESSKLDQRSSSNLESPAFPKPSYPPIFHKFVLPKSAPAKRDRIQKQKKRLTLKSIENILIPILEAVANLLDNLHLFSKLPMFPKTLVNLLKHTNKLWIFILVFLIRKTASQLLNAIRKERKVLDELAVLKNNTNSLLLDVKRGNEGDYIKKHEKILKDLRFDKMMLKIELFGDFLDLAFNIIELYLFPVPDWVMSTLNFASMAMTVYRMNKDDEYADDDISEELI